MPNLRIFTCALLLLVCGCGDDVQPDPPPAELNVANRDSMGLRLELFVDDVQASVSFYTGVLGFELLDSSSDYAPVRAGSVTLGLSPKSGLPSSHYFNPELGSQRAGLGTEIVLEVDDVENYYAAVQGAGYPIAQPLTERSWGATDFRVVDPDGYYLRLTSR